MISAIIRIFANQTCKGKVKEMQKEKFMIYRRDAKKGEALLQGRFSGALVTQVVFPDFLRQQLHVENLRSLGDVFHRAVFV